MLVDGVVGEMHAHIILRFGKMRQDRDITERKEIQFLLIRKWSNSYHIAVCWFVVLGGTEASESLLKHEYAEWIT